MTRTRTFMLIAVIATFLSMVGTNSAVAQVEVLASSGMTTITTTYGEEATPAASPTIYPAILALGANPPNHEWPCLGGTSDPSCPNLPAGGMVVAVPAYSAAHHCSQCGQLYAVFTGAMTGTATYKFKVVQKGKTIYSWGQPFDMGEGAFYTIIAQQGPNFTGVAGAATLEFQVSVGSTTTTVTNSIELY
jgi:hypothetical protein